MLLRSLFVVFSVITITVTADEELSDSELLDLRFTTDLPGKLSFANSTGTKIECQVEGINSPFNISWLFVDGKAVESVPGLREVDGGRLEFFAFNSEKYRPDVHSTVYRCKVSNAIGSIRSVDVHVNAVVVQNYDAQVYDVYAMEGNTAVLKCHVPTVMADYIRPVAWIKNNNLLIQTAFDEDGKYAVIDSGYLLIRNVSLSESNSNYKCKTENILTGETKISPVGGHIFVTESQSGNVQPKITTSLFKFEVNEGENVIIPCFGQGKPAPKLNWYRKSSSGHVSEIDVKNRILKTQSSLIIKNSNVSDDGFYICELYNDIGKSQQEFTLDVNVKLSANIVPRVKLAKVGDTVTFKCDTRGSFDSKILWLHDGVQLSSSSNDILTVVANVASQGFYQCILKNEKTAVQSSAELRLSEIAPYFDETFNEVTVEPNESVNVKCVASGIPLPNITWMFEESTLKNSQRILISSSRDGEGRAVSTLRIQKAVVSDGGLYSCLASNNDGETRHYSRINVMGPLTAKNSMKIIAVAGKNVYLNCPVFGAPIEKTVWTTGDNSTLVFNSQYKMFSNGTLWIKDVHRPTNNGKYFCTAQNSLKTAVSSVDVEVVVPPKLVPFEFQDDLLREGMRARLQCVVSEGDSPITITWLKDGKLLSSDVGLNVRALDDFSSILTINSILPSHNGKYTCIATNRAAVAIHSAVLSVNVPPKIVPFRFGDLLYEGSSTRVVCGLQDGDLPIHFNWLHDGVPVVNKLSVSVHKFDGLSSILSIEKLTLSHSGTYTCVARNGAGEAQYEAALNINVPPKIVPFAFQEDQLVEGQLARVTCIVSRGDLPLTLYWEKDGVAIDSKSLRTSVTLLDEFSSILSVPQSSPIHNGVYTCYARNSAGSSSYSAELVIKVPPRWIHKPKGTVFVLNGNRAVIDCQAEGYPKPTIEWTFLKSSEESGYLIKNEENRRVAPNGSLIIDNVVTENQGFYVCKANNNVGRLVEAAVEIRINAPPYFKPELEQIARAAVGKNVQWQCVVHGDKPMEIKWQKHNKPLVQSSDDRITVQTINQTSDIVSTLTIHKIVRDDSGPYQCVAENSFGTNISALVFTVTEPPDAPTDVKVLSQSSTTVEIEWKIKFNGNEAIKKHIIQYKEEKATWENAITMETVNGIPVNSIIGNLQPATTFNFRIYAENSIGRSLASQILTVTTDEDVPGGAPLDIQVESVNPETLNIEWKSPEAKLWNGKILGFSVGYKNLESEEPFAFKTLLTPDPRTNPHTMLISGMKQFSKYSIVVQAYTSKGKGPLSEPVYAMTSEGAPTVAPADVRCTTLTSQNVHVTWSEPSAESINGILRGYKVFYKSVSDLAEDEVERHNTTLPNSLTLKSLEKYTNYSIQVSAITKSADGPKSAPIFCKTLDDVPDAPNEVKASTASATSVVVSWRPPVKANGIIKSYTVYYREASGSKESSLQSVTPRTLNYEVSGLQKKTLYEFWVTASTIAGEGAPSLKIKQNTSDPHIPAKIVSIGGKVITGWKQDVTLECLTVGFPVPRRNWAKNGNAAEIEGKTSVKSDGSLEIRNIQEIESGDYVCTAVNNLTEDKITYSVTVLAPPPSPDVHIKYVTSNSIDISWRNGLSKLPKIKGYIIQIRKEEDDWREINVEDDVHTFKFENLLCGVRYEVMMSAFNRIGIGASSNILFVSTNGSVPSPPVKSDLIEEATNSISLYLNTWKSNGCPIIYYSVEYAPRSSNEWTLIANDVKPMQRRLVIPNLKSGTWYGLRMTAHNTAGSYVAEYNFATLTNVGATISPEFQADSASENFDGIMTYLNFYLIVPVICTGIVLLAILGAACFYIKMKNREQKRSRDLDNQMSVAGTLRPGARSGSFSYMQRRNLSSNDHGAVVLVEDELAPYATFQLANNMMDTMGRHGKAGVPLPPPPRFDGFPGSGVQELPSHGSTNQAPGPIETTFFFPHLQSEESIQAANIQFPVNYPQQGGQNLLFN